nr:hypothetical protein [Tanacetum cinerariifolium]
MERATQEAKLNAHSKPELIKVVEEVATEAEVDPKVLRSSKGGQEFLKKQDAKLTIIPKKKNKVVEYLMNSLCKKYERLKETPSELEIKSTLPPPKKVPSLSLSRKRKALELEPKVRIPSPECNRSLPEGVQFMNNKVIETPEHEIFFIDVFGDQTFQRINNIHKVEFESLLGYLVMARIVNTLENQRFC